jgi:hypothetical protein
MTIPLRTKCHYCDYRMRPHQITADHIIPRSRRYQAAGGARNIVHVCGGCNISKGNLLPCDVAWAKHPVRLAMTGRLVALIRQNLAWNWLDSKSDARALMHFCAIWVDQA